MHNVGVCTVADSHMHNVGVCTVADSHMHNVGAVVEASILMCTFMCFIVQYNFTQPRFQTLTK